MINKKIFLFMSRPITMHRSIEYEKDENDGKIYDKHTLYLDVSEHTHTQINNSINITLNKIGIKCAYKINMVGKKTAYLRVSSANVYNILIGNNPDGSRRIKMIMDPNFKPPEEPFDDALRKSTEDLGITDWYDICIAEEELDKMYTQTEIQTKLPPLVKLTAHGTNEEIVVKRAYICDDDKYSSNIIFSDNVPEWLTDEIIRPHFSCYVSKDHRKTKYGKKYPLISFKNNRWGNCVYISFSDKTYDTQFSILMNRCLKVINTKTRKSWTLKFEYMKKN